MTATKVLQLLNNNELEKLKQLATKKIREENAKKSGGTTKLKRQREAEKFYNEYKKTSPLAAGSIKQNNYQYINNSFVGFELTDHLEIPESKKGLHIAIEDILRDKDRYDRMNKNLYAEIMNIFDHVRIDRGRLVRSELTKEKYDLVINKGHYNPDFIETAINILGGEITYSNDPNDPFAPLFLHSENGTAFVLPLRRKQ